MRNVPGLEAVYQDYNSRGVSFHYIYKSLAHPGTNGYVRPLTLEERLKQIAAAKKQLGTRIPWVCDGMDNPLKHALGDAPNSIWVLDGKNRVVSRRWWCDPSALRRELAERVGPVAKPTSPSSIKYLSEVKPVKPAAVGVMPRLEVPGNMTPLKVTLLPSEKNAAPAYVKVRAELESKAMRDGKGRLYLGFFLDPLYHVHWNNLAEPLRFKITATDGTRFSEREGEARRPRVDADADPREFLLNVADMRRRSSVELTVSYFACNDDEGWCRPATQRYRITFEPDRDAGSRRRSRR